MPTRVLDGVLDSEDLEMCKRVFDQACNELGLDNSSRDNERLAIRILSLFQWGLRDEQELLDAVIAAKRDEP